MFRASEFKCKEVINLCDGERLGYVFDMEIERISGKIRAIIVPGRKSFKLFGRDEGIIVPWDCIRKIGEDIILVDIAN